MPSFTHQAESWNNPRRAIAKVEWHLGKLIRASPSSSPPLSHPAERLATGLTLVAEMRRVSVSYSLL